MFSLAIWKTCSPRTFATFFSSGTEFKRASTPTVAAVYPTVVVLVAPLPAIVPPVARIMTLPSVFGARASAAGSAAADSATANTPSPAEIHRLRGELTGRLPHPDPVKAEDSFRTALAIAREQGTRGYELRAATSLARLWRKQGRRAEARDLLAPLYGSFTEGFDTPDLKDAKALLEEL